MHATHRIGLGLAAGLWLATTLTAADRPKSADVILNEATAQAAASHRAVFAIFHASWCGWCKKLDAFLASPTVKPVIDRYFVIVHFDVLEHADKKDLATPGGDDLYNKWGATGGVPYFYFLDSRGEILATSREPARDGQKGGNIGHPAEPHEVDWFLTMLHKAAPQITAEEIAPLEKYLREQKK